MNAPGKDEILAALDAFDADRISKIDHEAMAAFLVGWMDDNERNYPVVNVDRYDSWMRQFRRSGHGDVDRAVMRWLVASPTPARVDIAAVVLHTLWNSMFGTRTIDPALVETLAALRDTPGLAEDGRTAVDSTLDVARRALAGDGA